MYETKENIGIYLSEAQKKRVRQFMAKRKKRNWTTKRDIGHNVRKNAVTSRFRIKGRFLQKVDQELVEETM